ncbi:hypothetical protein [Mycolicibacterium litorale]|uniref:Uncharacterized protein n=1 Tax=Mycolicibacterium litorale TaxID=758802 RepID=A0AAD1MVT3_9MYCO|nr:hypothetical protein [Mycolicibacterium litorale]MCV7416526.1 hypothetical protein [Mycolicibacterium litorale]BBY17727.1 hypothetical protein MLIT_33190 [Mycolicibacterium litorale]
MADEELNTPPDGAGNLPATSEPTPGEVVVSTQPEGLLVGGDPEAVEAYLQRLTENAGYAIQVVGLDKVSLGNATGLAASAASILGQSAKFVQLHPDSIKAVRKGQLIPGTDGFFRMTTRGADKKFVSQLQWKPTNVNPAKLMSAQMLAVQIALKTAISEVEDPSSASRTRSRKSCASRRPPARVMSSATACRSSAWSTTSTSTGRSRIPTGIGSRVSGRA